MAVNLKVRPIIPILGGVAGLSLATLQNKTAEETLVYGLVGAGLAWSTAAALIVSVAQGQRISQEQASALAGFIAEREKQRKAIPSTASAKNPLPEWQKQRIDREVTYLKKVLQTNRYTYQNGKALPQ